MDEQARQVQRSTVGFDVEVDLVRGVGAEVVGTAARTSAGDEGERGRGGRSLGFRLTFEDGSRGYFKPDQAFNGMSWNAEIAISWEPVVR